MKKLNLSLCLAALSLGGVISHASAAVLAEYKFTSGSASTDTELNSTAANMTSAFGGTSGFSSSSGTVYARRSPETTTTASGAVTGNDYFQFTVTPGVGVTLNLTSLTLKQYATTTETAADRWTSYLFVRSDALDNYGTNVDAATFTRGSGYYNAVTLPTSTDVTLNLSDDAAFQGIAGPVTFRIYLYHAVATVGGGDFHRIDDVVLNGAVVPEPSTSLSLLVGLGMAVWGRRRK
jgi:hypothetical protein